MEQEFQIKNVEDVRSFHIKSFLSMMDDKERKARYINDLLKVFKTFFNYLKKEGHIKERPTANVKNMKQRGFLFALLDAVTEYRFKCKVRKLSAVFSAELIGRHAALGQEGPVEGALIPIAALIRYLRD